jgi:hypothetical protein
MNPTSCSVARSKDKSLWDVMLLCIWYGTKSMSHPMGHLPRYSRHSSVERGQEISSTERRFLESTTLGVIEAQEIPMWLIFGDQMW